MMLSAFDKYVRAWGAMRSSGDSCEGLVHPVATATTATSPAQADLHSKRPDLIRPPAVDPGGNHNFTSAKGLRRRRYRSGDP
ncbi:hypothetical protein [Streptomyces arenae]|uniref:hypothetical protein n=1 Tax=Streptomyces arenae TaxID=29301 RepID=UPI00265A4347|nr:hypothetical protein [Streptomyces arenae]MCG7210421.1 hypothetical protein [Streptomyces arenae]